jgi:ubiquitin-conjugating enzyme E2 O
MRSLLVHADTIYVRAFEDRMDLLRAVMVGASGTPYHDGLFFFDLHLPPSYPAEPPLVNYRSFGLHVNPNLYPSGTVCLSLLNTFGGQGVELWSPEASSVLQVVVSIQGLVLTAQPYYNEPAYGAQAGTPMGRRNELPYSENAYLLTLQTMLHLLRRPPAGFEELVTGHFRRRGQHVLRACEAYLEGCRVGTLDGEARATDGSRERPCSAGFRLALLNLLPRLVDAFDGIGVQGFEQFHRSRTLPSTLQFATTQQPVIP